MEGFLLLNDGRDTRQLCGAQPSLTPLVGPRSLFVWSKSGFESALILKSFDPITITPAPLVI